MTNRSAEPAPLSVQQFSVMALVLAYARVAGEAPPVRVLSRRLGVHPSTLQFHLSGLYRKGFGTSATPQGILARLQ